VLVLVERGVLYRLIDRLQRSGFALCDWVKLVDLIDSGLEGVGVVWESIVVVGEGRDDVLIHRDVRRNPVIHLWGLLQL
jgi:hypothetical protein